ncbi:hypothetical protein DL95DRAFT_479391 [Leptodontidium sp. 2 PMI_412]|nr:hypothetical protein DL95DRAFT_479391 [Leptodontidium sp. 2 PMI_412]
MAPARLHPTPTKVFAQSLPLSPKFKNISSSELDKKANIHPASPSAGIQQDFSDKRWILKTSSRKTPNGLCEYCSRMMSKLTNEINIPSYDSSNPTCIYCSKSVPRQIIIYTNGGSSRVTLPTTPLTKRSEYFFNSLAKDWKEANSGIYHLSDTRIDDLRLFAVYIRNGDIDDENIESILGSSQTRYKNGISEQGGYAQLDKESIKLGEGDKIIHRFIGSYLLGAYLQSPCFRNAIMDQLVPRYRSFFNENKDRVPIWNLEWSFGGVRNSGVRVLVARTLGMVTGLGA